MSVDQITQKLTGEGYKVRRVKVEDGAYEVYALDANGKIVRFGALMIDDDGKVEKLIEGRYKDVAYVKNITAHYRRELDAILEDRPDLARASSGRTAHFFVPDPDKTFHRGSTDYFVTERKVDIGAFDSPTFTGLAVGHVEKVNKRDLIAVTHALPPAEPERPPAAAPPQPAAAAPAPAPAPDVDDAPASPEAYRVPIEPGLRELVG